MDIALTRINASPEVITKTWMVLCDFKEAIQIPETRKHELFKWAIDVTRKLESVKYHRDNLLRILNEEFQKRSANTEPANVTFIELNTGAEKEFEALLLQGKSTLDILAKSFVPLFGIKLHSYGDGGTKVSKSLRRNLKAEQLARAQPLLALIEQDKEWIEKWFCAHRDKVAHYRPIASSGFVTPPIVDGVPRHAPPTTSDGVAFHEAVVVLFTNLMTFTEDFLALAVSITFPRYSPSEFFLPRIATKSFHGSMECFSQHQRSGECNLIFHSRGTLRRQAGFAPLNSNVRDNNCFYK